MANKLFSGKQLLRENYGEQVVFWQTIAKIISSFRWHIAFFTNLSAAP
jgi:hypothetical protein